MAVKTLKNSIFFILFLHTFVFSQGFKGGINAGFVASQVDGDRLDGYDKPGFTAGLGVKYFISQKYSFYISINYIQKGSRKLADPEIPDDRFYILRLNYIEVPLIIETKLPFESKKKLPFLSAGLVIGYLYKAREDVDGTGFIEPTPPFKRYDIPIRAGLSYGFSKHLEIKGYYSYSIFPIRPHPGNKTWYFDRGQYNNYLTFNLFYWF